MTYIRHIFFTISFCLILLPAGAQQSNTLYFLSDVPQSSFLNPAFSPGESFIIGIPFMSGLSAGFNNGFKMNDAIQEKFNVFSDTLKFDFNSFYNSISDQNKLSYHVSMMMFYAGIRSGKNFYSLSVSEKGFFRGQFDKSFVGFFNNGTAYYSGAEWLLGGLSFDIGQYREVGFAFSRQADAKLSYGVRLKFLFGRINLSSEQMDFMIRPTPNGDVVLIPMGSIKISGPLTYAIDTIEGSVRVKRDLQASDYSFNLKNAGFGFDAGFSYKINRSLNLSASIVNSGVLKYSKKNFGLVGVNALVYRKDSLTQPDNPSAGNYFSGNSSFYAFRDSIPFMMKADPAIGAQLVRLPTELFLGAKYSINKKWSAGFVQEVFLLKGYSSFATSLCAEAEIDEKLRLAGTYTVTRGSFFNLGLGAVYDLNRLQFVFSTDNIFSLVSPYGVKNLNLHFGINLIIDKN